ncbi:hypothetical protein [Streptomyces chryseus]|uniref:Secreted protein n=1 Tax=Streptomyces chryseus TaxID=68186 RepID=A0ABQ3DLK0_9ACTN|nr:hypothetical protein [Streptomyces chryseus]GHB02273.1 hypothetical protein GCM10010346_26510 [Streptomyces chryseus]
MKKRSMLAVASLAVGAAIAALSPAPNSAEASTHDDAVSSPDVIESADHPEDRDADPSTGA